MRFPATIGVRAVQTGKNRMGSLSRRTTLGETGARRRRSLAVPAAGAGSDSRHTIRSQDTPPRGSTVIPFGYPPMEMRAVAELPPEPGWQYEPKWDGFRCLAFRNGNDVTLQSKAGQPLGRYFPEIVAALQRLVQTSFVLDGELVVPYDGALSFGALQQRIHPAASRVT